MSVPMKKILPILQYFPLSVFLGVARAYDFSNQGWESAFIWGGIVATLEFMILIPILGNRLGRLIAGANLFLIFGGLGFYFQLSPFMNFLGFLKEASLLFFVVVVCVIAILATSTGVFETKHSDKQKSYSICFLVGAVAAFAWSLSQRGNPLLGGMAPFVFLILFKEFLERRSSSEATFIGSHNRTCSSVKKPINSEDV
jgi:hypothetical protein